MRGYSEFSRTFLDLTYLQAIHPSFATITKALSNKTAETFENEMKG